MKSDHTIDELKRMRKKQLVQACGYNNMKALCLANPDLVTSNKKGPSRKTLIKLLS